MNKKFEQDYKNFIAANTPDIWDRIDAGVKASKRANSPIAFEPVKSKAVEPVKAKKPFTNYYQIVALAGAAACFALLAIGMPIVKGSMESEKDAAGAGKVAVGQSDPGTEDAGSGTSSAFRNPFAAGTTTAPAADTAVDSDTVKVAEVPSDTGREEKAAADTDKAEKPRSADEKRTMDETTGAAVAPDPAAEVTDIAKVDPVQAQEVQTPEAQQSSQDNKSQNNKTQESKPEKEKPSGDEKKLEELNVTEADGAVESGIAAADVASYSGTSSQRAAESGSSSSSAAEASQSSTDQAAAEAAAKAQAEAEAAAKAQAEAEAAAKAQAEAEAKAAAEAAAKAQAESKTVVYNGIVGTVTGYKTAGGEIIYTVKIIKDDSGSFKKGKKLKMVSTTGLTKGSTYLVSFADDGSKTGSKTLYTVLSVEESAE